jgi:CDP-glucose 4,6-dehydratase
VASLAEDLKHFAGRRVLITGHTGFKGSWLALMLVQAGARVTGIALPPQTAPSHFQLLKLADEMESRDCDIRDFLKLESEISRAKPEVVFHLAAQAFVRASYLDPHTTFSTNMTGSANVLECVSRTPSVQTLVFVTSDKCYKNKEQQHGYVESDELGGIDPYSQSKAGAELVFAGYCVAKFNRSGTPRVASARAGNVIGGGDWSPDRLIPDCVRALERGQTIDIRHPRATRPWQHVLEPLSGYVRLAVALEDSSAESGSSWNFGPPETAIHDVQEVASFVASRWGYPDSVRIEKDTSSMHESQLLQLNSAKAQSRLSWSTRWDFTETMNRTTSWYRDLCDGAVALELTSRDVRAYLDS